LKRRNRKGDGSLYRRKYRTADGKRKTVDTWTIEFPNGKGGRVKLNTGEADREKALSLLRARLSAVNAGTILKPGADQTAFKDLAGFIVSDYTLNDRDDKAIRDLQGRIAHLREAFGTLRAVEIDSARVEQYKIARKAEGAANGTVNRELSALHRMFVLAYRQERVARIPHMAKLKEADPREGFFEQADFAAVLRRLPDDLKPVAVVMYWTGWRVASEILTRQWKHVDLVGGWLRLEPGEGKTGQGRNFPLIPELRNALEAQRARVDELQRCLGRIIPWVFVWTADPAGTNKLRRIRRSRPGGGLPGDRIAYFRRSWISACERAGVAGRIPHDCRRTAARNLIRAGVAQAVAMKLTGHKTASVFMRYAIADDAVLREAGEKLSGLVTTSTPPVDPGKLVAWDGIEPPTRGFSVRCSTS
jgi:integrase